MTGQQNEHPAQATAAEPSSWLEQLEVGGNELVARIRELAQEGNARRVTIRTQDGDELLSLSLTVGAVAGGLVVLSAPVLAALGALAALVSRVRVEVAREAPQPPPNGQP